MAYTVNIYGRSDSKSPDITYTFEIGEHMHDGIWSNRVIQKNYAFHNELIDELTEETVIAETKKKVEELLNSPLARNFIISPVLRLYYDDESKKPVLQFK